MYLRRSDSHVRSGKGLAINLAYALKLLIHEGVERLACDEFQKLIAKALILHGGWEEISPSDHHMHCLAVLLLALSLNLLAISGSWSFAIHRRAKETCEEYSLATVMLANHLVYIV